MWDARYCISLAYIMDDKRKRYMINSDRCQSIDAKEDNARRQPCYPSIFIPSNLCTYYIKPLDALTHNDRYTIISYCPFCYFKN